ncbi:MAG: hypothetical protein AABY13_02105 [Nanoarchaeota archaeon]
MADIDAALAELRQTLLSIKFFDVALESLIVIGLALIVTTYFQLPWYVALVPWAIYFTTGYIRRVNVRSYHEVEDKVPQLREALSTAADTRGQQGILVKELQTEVLGKMRAIKTSYFLGLGSTTRQLLLLSGISFIIIGLAAFNVNFASTKDFALRQPGVNGALHFMGLDNETLTGKLTDREAQAGLRKFVKVTSNKSIFGEENIFDIGASPLELSIDPEMSGSNLQDVHDAEQKKFRDQEAGVVEASAQGACAEACDIPKDQQEIVKNYFDKVGTG